MFCQCRANILASTSAEARMSRTRTFYNAKLEANNLASAKAKMLKLGTILQGQCQDILASGWRSVL